MGFFQQLRRQLGYEGAERRGTGTARPEVRSVGYANGIGLQATGNVSVVLATEDCRATLMAAAGGPNTNGGRDGQRAEIRATTPPFPGTQQPDGGTHEITKRNPNPLRDAESELEVEVNLDTVEILSDAGELATSSEQRKLVCLLSDGRLLVAAGSDRYSPHVLSYIALLERRKIAHRPVQTRPARIAQLYAMAKDESDPRVRRAAMATKAKTTATRILEEATAQHASDIHLQVLHDHCVLKYRVDGELEHVAEYDPEMGKRLIRTYYQVLSNISGETFKDNERLDARIGHGPTLPQGLDGVRIATTPTDSGNKMVMRLLYAAVEDTHDLLELGMSAAHTHAIDALKELPIGMNIISGPTGSGKSTTLQRTLRGLIHQTRGTKHVITVEDPPEYPIPGAVQTPVGNSTTQQERAEKFTTAISSAMRLDPDIIMVGEIRDLPSAELSLRAATTGHQVWTTLHANNALHCVDRLVNMGMEKDMLLDHTVLTGLIAQRLVRKLCPVCRVPLREKSKDYSVARLEHLQQTFGAAFQHLYVTGPGCECCRSGTAGRTVVVEVVRPDAHLCSLLMDGHRVEARRYWMGELGGQTFMQHAIEKISEGTVDPFSAWAMLGPLMTDAAVLDSTLKKGHS